MFPLLKAVILFLSVLSTASVQAKIFEKTKKVSLVFVGPSRGISESSFGHLALRLSPDVRPGLLDMVVEFVADVPEKESAVKKYVKGVGVGSAYPVAAKLKPFYDFKRQKNIIEDRSLQIFELQLTEAETRSVAEFVENFQHRLQPEDYAFFTKNCSYFSALAIETVTGRKLGIKSFPWQIPKKLRKLGLSGGEENIPAASMERMRLARKFIERDQLDAYFSSPSWTETFISMLGEYDFTLRQSSYLKLLWVLQNDNTPETAKRRVHSLLRYLLSLETDSAQFILKNLFASPEKKRVIELGAVNFNGSKSSLKHELTIKNNNPVLQVRWTGTDGDSTGSEITSSLMKNFPLTAVTYDSIERSLRFDDIHVGRYVETKPQKFILTEALDYGLALDQKQGALTALLYVDISESTIRPKLSFTELKTKGVLALNNALDFKGELGSCYAMALLQKALLEKAFFIPALSKDSSLDKIKILNAVFEGQYVFIPGFANILEFTQSIPKETLKDFIRMKQKGLEKSKLAQVYDNYKFRTVLNQSSIENLKSLLSEGIIVPIVIGALKKNQNKLAGNAGHVILVFALEEIGREGYRLTTYDPNSGLSTLYTLDHNFNLHFPFYDKNFDYKALVDHLTLGNVSTDHAVRSRRFDTNILKTNLLKQKTLFLQSSQIFRVLE